jgi:hypothetical protein
MIYLHIGRRKTGTTTIQQFMARNAETLERYGVLYPTIARTTGTAHHGLATSMLKRGAVRGEDPRKFWSALDQLALDRPDKKIVVSTEALESVSPAKLRKVFRHEEVRILCYMRDAAAYTESAYTQSTKFGINTENFDTYFARRLESGRMRYSKSLAKWAKVFGAANVRVRSLDKTCLDGEDLITDFLSALGLVRKDLDLGFPNPKSKNLSPGWKVVELLRAMYESLPVGEKIQSKKRVLKAVGVIGMKIGEKLMIDGGRGQYLTLEQRQICNEEYSEDLSAIEALDLDSMIQPVSSGSSNRQRPFLPSLEFVPPEESSAFFRSISTKIISESILSGGLGSTDQTSLASDEYPDDSIDDAMK